MMKFKEYVNIPKRKYIAVQYDEMTQDNLRNWCYENGFDLSKGYGGEYQHPVDFDFHTTVFFTTSTHLIENGIFDIGQVFAIPTGMEYLGENKNIPVLKVFSFGIQELRNKFEKQYIMKDQWPQYKPHVSVSYNRENLPDINRVSLPKFQLSATEMKIDDAKEF